METKRNKFILLLYIVNLVVFVAFSFLLISNALLPTTFRFAYLGVMVVIQIALGIVVFRKGQSKAAKITVSMFTLFVLLFNGVSGIYAYQGVSTLDDIAKEEEEQVNMTLLTANDSSIDNPEDLEASNIIAPTEQDGENLAQYGMGDYQGAKDYLSAVDDFLNGKGKAVLINDAYMDLIKEKYPDFEERVKAIDSKTMTSKKENIRKDVSKGQPFNVYISGIDTYGNISTVSRSDVNIILSVNPNKNKIVMTSIPRDSYVKIAGGGGNQYDKLTHAGIYGVSSSVKTLENLFGTTLNYYGRVNFSSLIKMVDILGGIEVQNDQEFTAGNYHFPKGTISLDGQKALVFARERYNLADGDLDRGRNHEKIITGIIQKGTSPSVITNYSSILDNISSSVETNMPKDKMIELINNQISSNSGWDIQTIEIQGSGQEGLPSYAMPDHQLYMYVPEASSVKAVGNLLNSNIK